MQNFEYLFEFSRLKISIIDNTNIKGEKYDNFIWK